MVYDSERYDSIIGRHTHTHTHTHTNCGTRKHAMHTARAAPAAAAAVLTGWGLTPLGGCLYSPLQHDCCTQAPLQLARTCMVHKNQDHWELKPLPSILEVMVPSPSIAHRSTCKGCSTLHLKRISVGPADLAGNYVHDFLCHPHVVPLPVHSPLPLPLPLPLPMQWSPTSVLTRPSEA